MKVMSSFTLARNKKIIQTTILSDVNMMQINRSKLQKYSSLAEMLINN